MGGLGCLLSGVKNDIVLTIEPSKVLGDKDFEMSFEIQGKMWKKWRPIRGFPSTVGGGTSAITQYSISSLIERREMHMRYLESYGTYLSYMQRRRQRRMKRKWAIRKAERGKVAVFLYTILLAFNVLCTISLTSLGSGYRDSL